MPNIINKTFIKIKVQLCQVYCFPKVFFNFEKQTIGHTKLAVCIKTHKMHFWANQKELLIQFLISNHPNSKFSQICHMNEDIFSSNTQIGIMIIWTFTQHVTSSHMKLQCTYNWIQYPSKSRKWYKRKERGEAVHINCTGKQSFWQNLQQSLN